MTLALNATLGLATALLYLAVGTTLAQRATTSDEVAKARRSFVTWWVALAATTGLGSFQQLLAGFGLVDLRIHVATSIVTIPLLMVALAGLLQYLVYVHTGSHRWRNAILYAHLAVAASYLVIIAWLRPVRVEVTDWSAPIRYAVDPLPAWFTAYAIATIIIPVLVASFAYFTLAFRTRAKLARFRIFTVSGAFLFWFGSGIVAFAARWSLPADEGGWYWWPLAARAIAFASTLVILFAYRPPKTLEDRLRRLDEEATLRGGGGSSTLRLAYARRVTTKRAT